MADLKHILRTVSLDGGSVSDPSPNAFFDGEQGAHTFIITATRGGEPFLLSGAVSGVFLNPNDAGIALTGSIVDGAAVLTLSNTCYALTGRFTLTINVQGATIYECRSRVRKRSSATAYDPDDELNVATLSAEIAAMRAATAAASAAAQDASTAAQDCWDAINDHNTGTHALDERKVNKPISSPNGVAGQVLRTNGDGTTTWVTVGQPTDEQAAAAISEWLDDHPEATTTVQDGSITNAKLADALKKNLVYTFDTATAMQAASLPVGVICHTNGFYESGDCGDAWYTIAANQTANGMDVLACPNNLCAKYLLLTPEIRIEQFGAVAYDNNTTGSDDQYVNDIFARIFALGVTRVKFGKTGVFYRANDSILLPRDAHIDGNGCALRQTADATLFIANDRNITIENLNLIGNDRTVTTAFGISVSTFGTTDHHHLFFRNMQISEFYVGVSLDGSVKWECEVDTVRVINCMIGVLLVDCFSTRFVRLYTDRCRTAGIQIYGNCTAAFYDCNFGSIGRAFDLEGGTDTVGNLLIENSNFEWEGSDTESVGAFFWANPNRKAAYSVKFLNCVFVTTGAPANTSFISFYVYMEAIFEGCRFWNTASDPALQYRDNFFNSDGPTRYKLGSMLFTAGNIDFPRPVLADTWKGIVRDMDANGGICRPYSADYFLSRFAANTGAGALFMPLSGAYADKLCCWDGTEIKLLTQ